MSTSAQPATAQHFNNLTPAEAERLTLLAEECAEVIKSVCKIQRHGYEHRPDSENRRILELEIGDVIWAIRCMEIHGDIDAERIECHARYAKPLKARQYLHHTTT